MRKLKYVLIILVCMISYTSFGQTNDSTRKQYLGVLTLTEKYRDDKNWAEKETAIIGEHFQRLIKYKDEGMIILAGRTNYEVNNPDMMGLVIFYAAGDKEALQFMMDDPAVKNKMMITKVHPYSVAVNKCDK